jgi:hypothetical protein
MKIWAILLFVLAIVAFLVRLPLNHTINNREENKNYPSDWHWWYRGPWYAYPEFLWHQLIMLFIFWWFDVKPENYQLARLSNICSILAGAFFLLAFALLLFG